MVLVSKSASFWVSAARVAASRTPASSTTRPVSAGKSSANAARGRPQERKRKRRSRAIRRPRRSRRPTSPHQLPDEPPPPNEPPPPENPPPPDEPRRRPRSRLPDRHPGRRPEGPSVGAAVPRFRAPDDVAHDHERTRRRTENAPKNRRRRSTPCRPPSTWEQALPPAVSIPRMPVSALDDVVDAARDAAGKIVGAEARDDRILDDEPGDRVGERAFEPVADLDAHLALVRRDDQQHAVVLVLLADLPGAAELHAEILDRGALQRFQRDDDELVGGLGFERGELLGERVARRGIEDAGLVDHAAGERRKGERRKRGAMPPQNDKSRPRERDQSSRPEARPLPPMPGEVALPDPIRTSPAAASSRRRRP